MVPIQVEVSCVLKSGWQNLQEIETFLSQIGLKKSLAKMVLWIAVCSLDVGASRDTQL